MANKKDVFILKWFTVLTFAATIIFAAGGAYTFLKAIEPRLVSIENKIDSLTEQEVSNRIAIAQLATESSNYKSQLDKLEERIEKLR